jgi:hypothetical protein
LWVKAAGDDDPVNEGAVRKPVFRPCEHCGNVAVLRTTIPKFGDRPIYQIFCCDRCGALEWVAVP